jgi:cell division protein FtsX
MLAVLLLALGTAIMGGLLGTVYLLRSLQTEFVSALSVELELISDSEDARTRVMSRAEKWPTAEFVQYVPPEVTLREIQRETPEDLTALFGTNPFPAIVRVRFGGINLKVLDSLTADARRWPDVAEVSYPRRLWDDLENLASRFQGGLGVVAAALTILVVGLVGLCLRAQVRNRSGQWEFLLLSGIHPWMVSLSLLIQQILVGILGGFAACGVLYGLTAGYSWLFFRTIVLPVWFYAGMVLLASVLAIIAGLLSPRRFE